MLIDTHCHLDYFENIEVIIAGAMQNKVERFVAPATQLLSAKALMRLATHYTQIKVAVGIHPGEVKETGSYDDPLALSVSQITEILASKSASIVAIGECGLDFRFEESQLPFAQLLKTIQLQLFKQHCLWATTYHLPLVIHNRKATLELLEEVGAWQRTIGQLSGVFHCFTGSKKTAEAVVNLGFYLGIGGILTLDEGLQQVVKAIPLDHLLLETDAPYLTPKPTRDAKPWPNEPANLAVIAQKLAEIKNLSLDEVARITTENAKRLFHLP